MSGKIKLELQLIGGLWQCRVESVPRPLYFSSYRRDDTLDAVFKELRRLRGCDAIKNKYPCDVPSDWMTDGGTAFCDEHRDGKQVRRWPEDFVEIVG